MKVLVYGETTRQARKFYTGKAGEAVGSRVYADYDNGEEYDARFLVNPDKIKEAKKNGKRKAK